MNTTVRLKASEITKDWHVVDAAGRPLGRVASEVAILLRGKHKPTFEPHLDGGDFVIVVNASQVRVTGRKTEQIKYHRHSGYPGGLKTRSYSEQFARSPERVVEQAIWGMLPGGSLGEAMFRHLKVYRGATHPHQSQVVGSERARAAREEAVTAALGTPMKAPRLRPLAVPQMPPVPTAEAVAVAAAEVAPPAPKRAPRKVAKTTTGADQPSAVANAEGEPAAVAPLAEAPVDAGEPAVPAETKKPRARRKAGVPAAEAASQVPAAEAEAPSAAPEPKPAPKRTRRRVAPTSEE